MDGAAAKMVTATAALMRRLAAELKSRHPDLSAHEHLSDATAALDRDMPESASRHLYAAIGNLIPVSLHPALAVLDRIIRWRP